MSTWRERLRDASFRGVPFLVDTAKGQAGRRLVVTDLAERDKPVIEDVGGIGDEFSIEAIVIGDDYMDQRDALIAALNTYGPGKLVHPFIGEVTVSVRGPTPYTESTREGGLATFSIVFVEGDEPRVLAGTADTATIVEAQADVAIDAVVAEFEDGFSLVGAIQETRDLATSAIASATATIRSITGTVASVVNAAESISDAIDSFEETLNTLLDIPGALARAFAGIVSSVTNFGIDLGGDGGATPTDNGQLAMDAWRRLLLFDAAGAPATPLTPQQQLALNNQLALSRLSQRAATVEAARAVAASSFTTVDDAIDVVAQLDAKLDDLSLDAGDDLFFALSDVRTALRRHIEDTAIALPRLGRFVPARTMPAILIAQRLYQDPTRDQEIVDRNSVKHPGFVTGGVELLVVSDD